MTEPNGGHPGIRRYLIGSGGLLVLSATQLACLTVSARKAQSRWESASEAMKLPRASQSPQAVFAFRLPTLVQSKRHYVSYGT